MGGLVVALTSPKVIPVGLKTSMPSPDILARLLSWNKTQKRIYPLSSVIKKLCFRACLILGWPDILACWLDEIQGPQMMEIQCL